MIGDYLRLVSYALIILTSFVLYRQRKTINQALIVGDIIMAFTLFLTALHVQILNFNDIFFTTFILTPGAIIWATVHFYTMLDKDFPSDKKE